MKHDDAKIFRSSIGKVTLIKHGKTVQHKIKPRPVPFQTQNTHKQVLKEMATGIPDPATMETGDELLFKRPGLQNRVLKKLRRGEYRIEAELDLHGLIADEAKKKTARFLAGARNANKRCVRIIHGKGLGSQGGKPVIKQKINTWLRYREDVLAFCSATPGDGGTGAIYVLLRQ